MSRSTSASVRCSRGAAHRLGVSRYAEAEGAHRLGGIDVLCAGGLVDRERVVAEGLEF
jgi:hypothetical protein